MDFKEEIELIFGWKLKAVNDSDVIVTLSESGYIAITYGSHQFGDVQTLLIKIDDHSINFKSIPPVFIDLGVDVVNKLISVKIFS